MGGVRFENQIFIVVSTMVCRVILGIDLLWRSEKVSFDSNRWLLNLNDMDVKLYQHPKEMLRNKGKERKADHILLEAKKEYIIPGDRSQLSSVKAKILYTGENTWLNPSQHKIR